MRKHDQGSAAAARDRKGRFSARRKRDMPGFFGPLITGE